MTIQKSNRKEAIVTPLARCPKCGATFPKTLRECPNCGYSPFARPAAPSQPDVPAPDAPQAARPAPPRTPEPRHEFPEPPGPPEEDEGESHSRRRVLLIIIAAALALGLLAFAVFRLIPRIRADRSTPCARDGHVWVEATCTEPKTCSVCGETEGEPLGHDFVDNVCTRCGAYEKPFTFSDLSCERVDARSVEFAGTVNNFTDAAAAKLELYLEFFDGNKELVTADTVYLFEEERVPPRGGAEWSFRYDDSAFSWKYWRVSVLDCEFEE